MIRIALTIETSPTWGKEEAAATFACACHDYARHMGQCPVGELSCPFSVNGCDLDCEEITAQLWENIMMEEKSC